MSMVDLGHAFSVDLSDTRVEGEDTSDADGVGPSEIDNGGRAGAVEFNTLRPITIVGSLGKSINTARPTTRLRATLPLRVVTAVGIMLNLFILCLFLFLSFSSSLSPHFHDSLVTTQTTMMFAGTNSATETALFILRVISPSIVLLTTISLLTTRPSPSPTPSPITPVTVATRIPRHGLILSCLSFSSFIYLFDGLVFAIYAVLNKNWPQCTGIEINALIGLVAFSGLAAYGSWKEVHGVDVWLLRRMRISIFLSIILDATQAALYGTSMPKDRTFIFSSDTSHWSFLTCRHNRSSSFFPISV